MLNLVISCFENNFDADQLASEKPAYQDLHCFNSASACKYMLTTGESSHNMLFLDVIGSLRDYLPEIILVSGPGLQIRVCDKLFSYFSMETYVVGTQKNHLNEMVLLSTQNIC